MKLFAPKYYEKFQCIGSECEKNCCIGWEIDIDDETAMLYSTLNDKIGEKIRASISSDGECPHFRLCKGERCANLRDDNLCSIIAECGQEMIPEICREHPRFYNVASNFCEVGVGIACPTAAELVLSAKDHRVNAIGDLDTIGDEEFSKSYAACRKFLDALCDFPDKHKLNEIIKFIDHHSRVTLSDYIFNSMTSLNIDIDNIDFTANVENGITEEEQITDITSLISEICESFEILDDGYDEVIRSALQSVADSPDRAAKYIENNRDAFLNLLQYFLYRHLMGGVEDNTVYARTEFAITSALLILMISSIKGISLRDAAVDYSRNIEYSSENIYIFIDEIEAADESVATRLLISILEP